MTKGGSKSFNPLSCHRATAGIEVTGTHIIIDRATLKQQGRSVYIKTINPPCETCGKQLMSAKSRRKHVLLHTGKTPFTCTYCRRWFRLKVQRDCHQLRHSHTDDLICSACGRMFGSGSTVKAHMLNKHGLLIDGLLPPSQRLSPPLPGLAKSRRRVAPSGNPGEYDRGDDTEPGQADAEVDNDAKKRQAEPETFTDAVSIPRDDFALIRSRTNSPSGFQQTTLVR
jgi:hypothetical protein